MKPSCPNCALVEQERGKVIDDLETRLRQSEEARKEAERELTDATAEAFAWKQASAGNRERADAAETRLREVEAALRDGERIFRKPADGSNAPAEMAWLDSARRLLGRK